MAINPTTDPLIPQSSWTTSSSEAELHPKRENPSPTPLQSPVIFRRIPTDSTSTTTLITSGALVFDIYNRHQAGHEKLGKGAKKNVYTASHKKTKEVVAYLSCKTTKTRPDAIFQEYQLNLMLKDAGCEPIEGSYLVKPWASKKDGTHREVYLAKKWSGDLFDLVANHPEIAFARPNTRYSIGLQLSHILSRLHQLNYIHRDFKLENILYGLDECGGLILRLSDLDSAVEIGSIVHDFPGTPSYLPPEAIIATSEKKSLTPMITKQYDGWQLGIALRLLFTQWWIEPIFGHYMNKAMNIMSSEECSAFLPYALRIFKSTPSLQSEWVAEAAIHDDPIDYAIYKLQQFDPKERWTPEQCFAFLSASKCQESPSLKRQRTHRNH
ncbi:MAG: hypothetical protein K2P51_00550 [Rhabdochlamydiaceae bacterium]|nr:hypothetical protein [Rhabdochlamydiaceae bacterium]